MSRPLAIETPAGSRPVPDRAFPLSCGGAEADLTVDDAPVAGPVLWIGRTEGELFVEDAGSGVSWTCNGLPVASSQWLRDGDEIRVAGSRLEFRTDSDGARLRVEPVDADETTAPPTLVSTREVPGDASSAATIRPVDYRPASASPGRPAPRRRIRPAALLAWVVVVGLGAAAWFVFTMRSIEIRVEPEPERLVVERGFPVIPLAGRYLLRRGSYRVVAEKEGYAPLDREIVVDDASNQRFDFTLERLPDEIDLRTEPARGARVSVDGVEVGVTPLSPLSLAPGKHEILVEAERYAPHREVIEIDGGGDAQVLAVELRPLWAAVRFASEPSGAEVRVDGEPIGRTPVSGELLEGRRRVELRLAGYEPFFETIRVEARTPLEVGPVRLDPADALVRVESVPGDAIVTVDGEYGGETPARIALEPGREVQIGLSKPGYEPAARRVTPRSAEEVSLTFELEPRYGEVTVTATPEDALLFVDDVPRGAAEGSTLRLIAVPHRIEVKKEGYVPYRTQVTPKPGLAQAVRAVLKTEEQIRAERIPPRIETSQGQAMVLIEGGRFRMGAPRREPGRRSNETEREVELTRAYYLSTQEVTNRQYREFDPRHLSGAAGGYNLEVDNHPVVRVSWEEAALYCNWLSEQEQLEPVYERVGGQVVAKRPPANGYRLPTEAEWAWAARFDAEGKMRKYSWGDSLPVTKDSGNYADLSAEPLLTTTLDDYDDGYPATAPVDRFGADARGLFNVGGNVAEWVQDIYVVRPAGEPGVAVDPLGPVDGELHVIRGSGWMDATVSELRLTYRDYGDGGRPDVGFRIARYAE